MRVNDPATARTQLKRAQEGDVRAVQDLFAWHVPRLKRWARSQAYRWPSGFLDYEDLVQDAILKTLRRLSLLDVDRADEVQAYMRGVLLNLVRDSARQARREPVIVPLGEDLESEEQSPALALAGRQAQADYRAAWAQLSPRDRDCIRSRLEYHLPYEAIADRLAMPSPNAARVAFGRALRRLCRLMKRPDCDGMRAPASAGGRARRHRTKSAPPRRQLSTMTG